MEETIKEGHKVYLENVACAMFRFPQSFSCEPDAALMMLYQDRPCFPFSQLDKTLQAVISSENGKSVRKSF